MYASSVEHKARARRVRCMLETIAQAPGRALRAGAISLAARRLLGMLAPVALLLACRSDSPQSQPAPSTSFSFAACVDPQRQRPAQRLSIAGQSLIREGWFWRAEGTAGRQPLRLGALADMRDASPSTLATLRQIYRRFVDQSVDGIVVLGGFPESYEDLLRVLGVLDGKIPLLLLPGSRVSREGFAAAVTQLRGPAINLAHTPLLRLSQLTIAAVPGYHLRRHLLAADSGCHYRPAELRSLIAQLVATPSALPRLLLAHGPPRGVGPLAVDRGFGNENIGDPALVELLERGGVHFGLFAHISESAGHATSAAQVPLAADEPSASLWLNVGSASGQGAEGLDGRWLPPMAALLSIAGREASYSLLKLKGKPPAGLTRADPLR
ncbi:MAG: hypothetical protein H6707_14405 [Deltaproteobacteria bacterium]|nr:hypothetical protein [Deltaproteobacteria bacterium]